MAGFYLGAMDGDFAAHPVRCCERNRDHLYPSTIPSQMKRLCDPHIDIAQEVLRDDGIPQRKGSNAQRTVCVLNVDKAKSCGC